MPARAGTATPSATATIAADGTFNLQRSTFNERGTGRYNVGMDEERPITDEPESEPRPEAPARPPVDVSLLPPLPVHPRSQRMAGTNIGRWATFGCVAVLLLLVVLLMVGVNLTKRTMWMSYARAQQRIIEELPRELASGERLRTERNLQRFRARMEATPDPFALMGSFLGKAGATLEDDRLTTDEVAELNRFIEDVLDEAGGAGR